MKLETFKNLRLARIIISGFSYLKSIIIKKKEDSLENFYINRFGKKPYRIFFEGYTDYLKDSFNTYIDKFNKYPKKTKIIYKTICYIILIVGVLFFINNWSDKSYINRGSEVKSSVDILLITMTLIN